MLIYASISIWMFTANVECLNNTVCVVPDEPGYEGQNPQGDMSEETVFYERKEDFDGDGVSDAQDNCPYKENSNQSDSDADGFGDLCDNCPEHYNSNQTDFDADGDGTVCDSNDEENIRIEASLSEDTDFDNIKNNQDNCKNVYNPDQKDQDSNGVGDVCDLRHVESCKISYPSYPDICLDEKGPLKIVAKIQQGNGVNKNFHTGFPVEMYFYTNKKNTPHSWTAVIEKAPSTSSVFLRKSVFKGDSLSDYRLGVCDTKECEKINTLYFIPDVKGEYVVSVIFEVLDGVTEAKWSALNFTFVVEGSKYGCSFFEPQYWMWFCVVFLLYKKSHKKNIFLCCVFFALSCQKPLVGFIQPQEIQYHVPSELSVYHESCLFEQTNENSIQKKIIFLVDASASVKTKDPSKLVPYTIYKWINYFKSNHVFFKMVYFNGWIRDKNKDGYTDDILNLKENIHVSNEDIYQGPSDIQSALSYVYDLMTQEKQKTEYIVALFSDGEASPVCYENMEPTDVFYPLCKNKGFLRCLRGDNAVEEGVLSYVFERENIESTSNTEDYTYKKIYCHPFKEDVLQQQKRSDFLRGFESGKNHNQDYQIFSVSESIKNIFTENTHVVNAQVYAVHVYEPSSFLSVKNIERMKTIALYGNGMYIDIHKSNNFYPSSLFYSDVKKKPEMVSFWVENSSFVEEQHVEECADFLKNDLDKDRLTQCEELFWGTSDTLQDTDGDGLLDKTEILWGSDPSVNDVFLDADEDGLTDIDEFFLYGKKNTYEKNPFLQKALYSSSFVRTTTHPKTCYSFELKNIPLKETVSGENVVFVYKVIKDPFTLKNTTYTACFKILYNPPVELKPFSAHIDVKETDFMDHVPGVAECKVVYE